MSWRDGFHAAVKKYLEESDYPIGDIDYVINVEGDEPGGGYCDTCGPDPQMVTITYHSTDG